MSKDQNLLPTADRDGQVLRLYEQLLEIEQRLIPTGLHVFGRPSESVERADVLRMVASFDRPEAGARAVTDLVAEGLGFSLYTKTTAQQISPEVLLAEHERVDAIVAAGIREFVADGSEAAVSYLEKAANVKAQTSQQVFALLQTVSEELSVNSELESLVRALRGEYIAPGPGADIVQNPLILPTGRNTHAINPYAVPSAVAFTRGEAVATSLLQRYHDENGRYPQAMALVLWGLDNIKTQGEGVAQALWLLGVRPVRDSLNRATGVEAISLEQLGRPRIDVVMTVSGIFRDLFSPTVQLLDKAVRRVAALDEPLDMNYVRRNVLEKINANDAKGEQAGRLRTQERNVSERIDADGFEFDDAVTRVFSNAPGNYGTNVNFMVMQSAWENDATLGDLFVTRKCFAYARDSKGRSVEGREARELMDDALSRVEATYQNIDSFEVGITDVDHYFEYLGGISKAVETRAKSRPSIYLSDSLSPQTEIRSLEETVRLETRAKTLNPKWYEGMLKHGFRGVAEIENHVANTFGWSATADAVDPWIYTEISKTFLLDPIMLNRLRELNPHSLQSLARRLLEAHNRGYWNPDEELLEKISDLVDVLEGAPSGNDVSACEVL